MLRILHVGLGPLGVKIVSDLYERGLGKVVAAVDVAPDIAGQEALDSRAGRRDRRCASRLTSMTSTSRASTARS